MSQAWIGEGTVFTREDCALTAFPSGVERAAVTSPRNSVVLVVCCLCCDEGKGALVLVHVDMKSKDSDRFHWRVFLNTSLGSLFFSCMCVEM